MVLYPTEISKIIIFRALQLGDMLCVIPTIRALRHAYPQAQITLAGLPWANSLLERFPDYFDSFIPFPGYPGLPEQKADPIAFTRFLTHVQEKQFDLALQMQGDGSVVNPMVELFGARYTAGFRKTGHYAPNNGLFLDYPGFGPEIERHLKLMDHLGIPLRGTELEFPITAKDYNEFDDLNIPVVPGNYVCIHPGSRGSWRQWPTAHFAAMADYCMQKGLQVVITGTKEELDIVADMAKQMQHEPVIAAGKTSLGAMAVLINNSHALISNCTGVSHIASAFKKASIVISMDGEPERWAPINKSIHHVIDWNKNPDFDLVQGWLTGLLR